MSNLALVCIVNVGGRQQKLHEDNSILARPMMIVVLSSDLSYSHFIFGVPCQWMAAAAVSAAVLPGGNLFPVFSPLGAKLKLTGEDGAVVRHSSFPLAYVLAIFCYCCSGKQMSSCQQITTRLWEKASISWDRAEGSRVTKWWISLFISSM